MRIAIAMLGLGVGLACSSAPLWAREVQVQCPKAIETTTSLRNKVSGWQVMDSKAVHYWQGVTFYDGHPKENASLAPEKNTDAAAVWSFTGTAPIYAACGYYRTSLELYQALPQGVMRCTVRYDTNVKGEQGNVPTSLACEVNVMQNSDND
jgi:hypothetical protein